VDNDQTQCIKLSSLNLNRYYPDTTAGRYLSCNRGISHCLECNSNNVPLICNKCEEGYFFVSGVKTQCTYEINIDNHYLKVDSRNYKSCSLIINHCQTCESEHKCLSYDTNYGILDEHYTQCQAIPTDNPIFNDENNQNLYYTCNKIIEGCRKCNSRNNCLQTISNNYCIKNDGSVIKLNEINNLFFYDSNNRCISCGDNTKNGVLYCLLCPSSNNCYKCQEGYTIVDNVRNACNYIATYNNNNEYFTIDNGINYYHCYKNDLTEKAIQNCKKCEYDSISEKNNCL
jgi:hypothetical protein